MFCVFLFLGGRATGQVGRRTGNYMGIILLPFSSLEGIRQGLRWGWSGGTWGGCLSVCVSACLYYRLMCIHVHIPTVLHEMSLQSAYR